MRTGRWHPFSLSGKMLMLVALNIALLGLAAALITRVWFRMDTRSFLLAPAQDRIVAAAHAADLELEATEANAWDAVLERHARRHGVRLYLFRPSGEQLAGPQLQLPRQVGEKLLWRAPGRRGAGFERGPVNPPLFFLSTEAPVRYWAGVRLAVRSAQADAPRRVTLILMSDSVLRNSLFFDAKHWLIVVFTLLSVSGLVWLPFIWGVSRDITEMTKTASSIAEGHFDIYVDQARRDEIGQLGGAINHMASRLAGYVDGQKRFLAGVAHELCGPLAAIQFGLGSLERRVLDGHRVAVADIRSEAEQMSVLVNDLLCFSRAGLQQAETKTASTQVSSILRLAIDRERTEGANIQIEVDEELQVSAGGDALLLAVSNILRNAIRYAGRFGAISVSAVADHGEVLITVSDCGPGVPESALEEMFTPFFRLDPSRDRATGGAGLGLAIVRASIEACHGTVRARRSLPLGLAIEIRLPAADVAKHC